MLVELSSGVVDIFLRVVVVWGCTSSLLVGTKKPGPSLSAAADGAGLGRRTMLGTLPAPDEEEDNAKNNGDSKEAEKDAEKRRYIFRDGTSSVARLILIRAIIFIVAIRNVRPTRRNGIGPRERKPIYNRTTVGSIQ